MTGRTLGAAVIGLGQVGPVHARVLGELPGVRLVNVCDLVEERAEQAAERFGAERWSTDYSALLEDDEIDVVFVCTPDHLHREPCVAVAQAGKHLFVEKPLASTLEDADAIIGAAEGAGVVFTVGHVFRFDLNFAKIKEAASEPEFGEPLSCYGRQSTTAADAHYLGGRVGINFYASVHSMDAMGWFLEARPTSVHAEAVKDRIYEEVGKPDGVWTLIRFEGGKVGCDEAFWCLPAPLGEWDKPAPWASAFTMGDCRLELIGSKSAINLEYPPTSLRLLDPDGWKFPDTTMAPLLHGSLAGAFREQIVHFLRCVENGTAPLVRPAEARQAMELAIAAELSVERGETVELPLT